MTKAEKIQVEHIWAELENIVTVLDPSFNVQKYIKLKHCDKKSFNDIQGLLAFLRIGVKYIKFETEALQREGYSLLELVEELQGGK